MHIRVRTDVGPPFDYNDKQTGKNAEKIDAKLNAHELSWSILESGKEVAGTIEFAGESPFGNVKTIEVPAGGSSEPELVTNKGSGNPMKYSVKVSGSGKQDDPEVRVIDPDEGDDQSRVLAPDILGFSRFPQVFAVMLVGVAALAAVAYLLGARWEKEVYDLAVGDTLVPLAGIWLGAGALNVIAKGAAARLWKRRGQ